MKIKPSLLQAITLGLLLPCISSCSLNPDHQPSARQSDSSLTPYQSNGANRDTLQEDSTSINQVPDDFACPACGKG